MTVYTVHGPRAQGTSARPASDRIVLVRDGFYFWAFAAGLLWLAYHRLWLALLGYIVVTTAAMVALNLLDVPMAARLTVLGLIALLTGFEAASLWRWTLSRGKWRQLDIVVAEDRDAAERRFFERSSAGSRGPAPLERGAPPPVRDYPGLSRPVSSAAPRDIIGSFPQPGERR